MLRDSRWLSEDPPGPVSGQQGDRVLQRQPLSGAREASFQRQAGKGHVTLLAVTVACGRFAAFSSAGVRGLLAPVPAVLSGDQEETCCP